MKKLIALSLAMTLVVSLSACVSTAPVEPAPAAPAPAAAAPAPAAAPEAPAAAEPAAPAASADPFADLQPVTLIGADNAGRGAAAQLYGELIVKKAAELTGGKLTIDYFPNSQLGNDQELQNQMLSGDIDFVICQTAQTVNFVPEVAIFDLPMAFAKYDAAKIDKALNKSGFTSKINEAYMAKGMRLLHYLQGGTYRETTSNKEVRKLDDFKGVKIRTMENANHMAFWSTLGASPTPLAFSELYVSLQQGLIDAQENATDTCVGANLFEVQKYLVKTHHILYCNQFLINNSKFEGLAPAYQEALQKAVDEAAVEIEAELTKIDAENTKTLADNGMEVIELDAAFIDEALAAVSGVYDDISGQVGKSLVDLLLAELAK